MFYQRLNGEEVEEEQEEENDEDVEEFEEAEELPSLEIIKRKLIGNGVTYDDLVKNIMLDHDEYSFDADFEAIAENNYAVIKKAILKHTAGNVPDTRFNNIFNREEMPDFASLSREELKAICRDYGIRYTSSTVLQKLSDVWTKHSS